MTATTAPTTPATTTPAAGSRLGYLPGLDGVRAVAVILVLLFHNGFTWMSGGFLGVSVFFTLSGYLITSLLLAERDSAGSVALGAFWRRRFRRLLPASLVAMVVVVAFGVFAADATQRAELGGDMVASLAYVANWWFLATEQTYAALFSAPSPLLHFWSLAIEEQFYLVLPLVAWAAFGRPGRSANRGVAVFTAVVAVTVAVTVALPWLTSASPDWLYYATPARMPELLTGVLLAVVLSRRGLRQRLTSATGAVAVAGATVAGVAALAAIVALSATSSTSSAWLYRGGFAAFSLVSVALIVSVHCATAPTTRLLGVSPLRHLGVISYGVYILHWPIFLWIDPARTGLDGWALFAVRMAVVLALAELSYRFIETPIRTTGRLRIGGLWRPVGRLAPVAIVVLVAAGVATSATAPAPALDFDRAEQELSALTADSSTSPTAPVAPDDATADIDAVEALLPVDPPTARLAVFGDSTAMMTAFGMGAWLAQSPAADPSALELTEGAPMLGCGIGRGGERRLGGDLVEPIAQRCVAWPDYWRQRARAQLPNVALVQVGPWDVMTRRLGDGPFVAPGDPAWDQAATDDMLAAIDVLNDQGVYVIWATAPLPNANLDPATHFAGPENVDPARFARLNTLIERLPSLRPGGVEVLDMAAWQNARPDDLAMRPDGVHLSDSAGFTVAQDFLAAEVVARFNRAWADGDARRVQATAIASWADIVPLRTVAPGEPLRVVVWSDARAPLVAGVVEAWAAGAGVAAEVTVVAPADCGVAVPTARRDGDVTTPAAACASRDDLRRALADTKPQLVVVAPGLWESAEHQPWSDWDQWRRPSDPFIRLWMLDQWATGVDAARLSGAAVVVVNLPDGSTPDAAEINTIADQLTRSPARGAWLRLADLRAGADPAGAIGDATAWALDAVRPATAPAGEPGATP